MYKITNVTDRQGIIKQEFIDDMKSKHGDELLGDFVDYQCVRDNIEDGFSVRCCFVWANNSNQMMRTSLVESVEEYDNTIKITTRNSVYEFEKVVEER